MFADDFVRQYQLIEVPEFLPSNGVTRLFGYGGVPAPVREYSNALYPSRHGISYADRLVVKKLLQSTFFPKMAKDPKSGILKIGSTYRLVCSTQPIDAFENKSFQTVFGGKASPTLLRKFIQLFNFWRGHMLRVEGASVNEIAFLVEQYLGTDCNGFVGNYLLAKYPDLDVDPNNPEETYHTKSKRSGGVVRKSLAEIAPDDIVIFPGHIGVISSVLARTAQTAIVRFSESRSRHLVHGGPQTNTLKLEYSSKSFQLEGRKPVLNIVRIPGM
jgi:hypothetical protein